MPISGVRPDSQTSTVAHSSRPLCSAGGPERRARADADAIAADESDTAARSVRIGAASLLAAIGVKQVLNAIFHDPTDAIGHIRR